MNEFTSKQLKVMPKQLQSVYRPPKRLYYKGAQIDDLSPSVAIVGTRRPTKYGQLVTQRLVHHLVMADVTIISGLALGVDTIAHKACLKDGGRTIAVLPCGIDTVYPRSHHYVAKQILESGGSLISEYEGASNAVYKSRFIERNRLVSGFADALLITEAAEKSGTTSTANFALDQGKTVMVVPGNITSVMSRGTNSLIKQGAIPITSPQDILEALGLNITSNLDSYQPASKDEATILQLIKAGYDNKDEISFKSGLEPAVVYTILTKLEISRVI